MINQRARKILHPVLIQLQNHTTCLMGTFLAVLDPGDDNDDIDDDGDCVNDDDGGNENNDSDSNDDDDGDGDNDDDGSVTGNVGRDKSVGKRM